MVGPAGPMYVGLHADEAGCWQVALGWPSADEIDAHKRDGYAVFPAALLWQANGKPQPRLTDDELDAMRQADSGRLNYVTLSQFRAVARAVEEVVHARMLPSSTQPPCGN